jgi:colanic acid/amylovoran biosynthesis glycosyltransferase
MLTVAYLANEYPSAVERYVGEEIRELQSRGVRVVAGSVRKPQSAKVCDRATEPAIIVQSAGAIVLLRALCLCASQWRRMSPLLVRLMFQGNERPWQRLKAVAHTFLGACYAVMLGRSEVDHIHVHHGYFGSWIAMTAARLLRVGFSMTLHGSDLLLRGAYLDVKLAECRFCLTISDYNRNYILRRYPDTSPGKIVVSRLGVEIPPHRSAEVKQRTANPLKLVSVGRLHAVKNHEFLVRACAHLRDSGVTNYCEIAGDGPEKKKLEFLIRQLRLNDQVKLLGHIAQEQLGPLYDSADLVVLTSRSEGIPLVLMEAMARKKLVLAPAITGITELVTPARTGFLFQPGSAEDFLRQVIAIDGMLREERKAARLSASVPSKQRRARLEWIRHAARTHVSHNFNRKKNLEMFCDIFLERTIQQSEEIPDANLVLQQI